MWNVKNGRWIIQKGSTTTQPSKTDKAMRRDFSSMSLEQRETLTKIVQVIDRGHPPKKIAKYVGRIRNRPRGRIQVTLPGDLVVTMQVDDITEEVSFVEYGGGR